MPIAEAQRKQASGQNVTEVPTEETEGGQTANEDKSARTDATETRALATGILASIVTGWALFV